ncbi:uncharacterized protein JCM6883_003542 [Sporobolomyces salmoneus]|uniref:uncharacterized protein n=1 Tax=Sporobolomyces salmoneus TaxID=183962 RepID=UPI0031746EBC
MCSTGPFAGTGRSSQSSRVAQTNAFITLANGPSPALAVPLLSTCLSDPTSFALASPTFEALNRITYAYALLREGQKANGRVELEKVGRLIERDGGKDEYFNKIRERARNVVEKRKVGIVKGINDRDDYPKPKSSKFPAEQMSPLEPDLLIDFSDLSLESEGGEEVQMEGPSHGEGTMIREGVMR